MSGKGIEGFREEGVPKMQRNPAGLGLNMVQKK